MNCKITEQQTRQIMRLDGDVTVTSMFIDLSKIKLFVFVFVFVLFVLHASPHKKHIQVLTYDTDIFVLLVYFTYYNPTTKTSMKKYNGQFIDINATV